MTILDNYMFRPLLAIFRLSLTELKVLLLTELCLNTYPFHFVVCSRKTFTFTFTTSTIVRRNIGGSIFYMPL